MTPPKKVLKPAGSSCKDPETLRGLGPGSLGETTPSKILLADEIYWDLDQTSHWLENFNVTIAEASNWAEAEVCLQKEWSCVQRHFEQPNEVYSLLRSRLG